MSVKPVLENLHSVHARPVLLMLYFVQMALVPRNAQGQGWLRPAIGVVELSQCIIQVIVHHPLMCVYNICLPKQFNVNVPNCVIEYV